MLNFTLNKKPILSQKSDCLLLFIKQNKNKPVLSDTTKWVDGQLNGQIKALSASGEFCAKAGEVVTIYCDHFAHARVLLVGIGSDTEDAFYGVDAAFKAVAPLPAKKIMVEQSGMDKNVVLYSVVAAGRESYQFALGGHLPKKPKAKQFVFCPPADLTSRELAQAAATAEGVRLTRHLAEQPSNICTPQFLATTAQQMAKSLPLKVKILNEKQMEKLGMNTLLAVAKGSANPPRLIVLEYKKGSAKQKPIALVGKGVTFDTGGISLKPGAAMDEMKFDMGGAATVFGTMQALALSKMPAHVVGVVGAVENMPDGNAVKPGDVVKAMSGLTVEILNTDAEGRLVLADALAYAEKFYAPNKVIDIATLTGACIIALGACSSGLIGRNQPFLDDLLAAGVASGDSCWQLPINKHYQRQLKSAYADLANIGGRAAGTITAACFLSRFVKCDKWAHLDIAGTAWNSDKRATGRPVPLLMHYLQNYSSR